MLPMEDLSHVTIYMRVQNYTHLSAAVACISRMKTYLSTYDRALIILLIVSGYQTHDTQTSNFSRPR